MTNKVTPGTTIVWQSNRKQTTIIHILLVLLTISVLTNFCTLSKSHVKDKATAIPSMAEEGDRIIKPQKEAALVASLPPAKSARYAPRIIGAKEKAYIDRFAKVAKMEMEKYGIPASIKLAQGLLESNKGQSNLTLKANNHFGIKATGNGIAYWGCNSKGQDCAKYKIYPTAWASYRDHSKRLSGKRYKHLKQYGKDYKKWAHGLKKAGYATDKSYAQKLIRLIEELSLYHYDT